LTSQRTRAALQLAGDATCLGCILATGTPMRNGRPCNLYPLLVGIRHPIARNKLEYDKTYCAAKKTKFVAWDTSGASNLPQLRAAIGPSLMRKTKEECLDIPLLTRRAVHVDVAAADMAEYDALLDDMRREVKLQHAAPGGSKARGGGVSALELMSRLRVFTSNAKVPGTAAVVRAELRRCPDPVVVFVWFKETAAMLLAALAERLHPLRAENPIPDGAEDPAGDRGREDRQDRREGDHAGARRTVEFDRRSPRTARQSAAFSPPMAQTSAHSSSVTGCTESRIDVTSATGARSFSALYSSLV
jgi:hypothetical protein